MGLFDFLKPKPKPQPTPNPTPNVEVTVRIPTPTDIKRQQEDAILEIRRLRKAAYPSANGLKPHEIMLLSYAPRYKTSGNTFPQFWRYEYAIENPQKLLDELAAKGFIRESTAAESLNALKVAELKEILSSRGLKTTGKKADLISRTVEAFTEEELGQFIPARQYALTELGARELEENQYVTYFGYHVKYGLTVWLMNLMLRDYPKKLWRDKIWAELNRRLQAASEEIDQSLSYDNYERVRGEMCAFLMEEGQHPEAAFEALNESTYLQCCLIQPYSFLYRYAYYSDVGKRDENSEPKFEIFIEKRQYFAIQEAMEFSDERMTQALLNAFSGSYARDEAFERYRVPKDLFSAADLATLIMAEIAEDDETAERIRLGAENRLKKLKPTWKWS